MSRHPITWRTISAGNVQAPDFRGASAMMDSARQSMGDSMSGIQNVLGARQQVEQDNRENEIGNNTDRFLNTLQQRYQSPEQMAQAQASGEIDALRQEFGAHGLDSDQTGAGAVSDLISGRREDVLQDQRYADTQQQRGNRDALNQFETRLARGELEDAQGILENTDFQNRGELEGRLQGAIQDREQQQRERLPGQMVSAQLNNFLGREDEVREQAQNALQDAGLDVDFHNPDFDSMTDPEIQRFREVVAPFRQAEAGNSSLQQQELFQEILEVTGDPELASQYTQRFAEGTELGTQLSPVDEREFERREQQLADQYDMNRNPIYHMRNSDRPVTEEVNEVVDNLTGDGSREGTTNIEDFGGGMFNSKEDAVRTISQAMTRGLEVGGERVPIDGDTMELILKSTRARRLFKDGNLESRGEEVLAEIGYDDYMNQYNNYQTEMSRLDAAKQNRTSRGPGIRSLDSLATTTLQGRDNIRGNLDRNFERELQSRMPREEEVNPNESRRNPTSRFGNF